MTAAATSRFLAIIPARGGSKRLARKNVLPFRGKPMIAWTVRAALESSVFDRVVVTTEDDEISQAAADAGADLIRRPNALASDDVPLAQVAAHALGACPGYDSFCLMMANCPLRNEIDVCASRDLFLKHECAVPVMSVFSYNWNQPFWAMKNVEGRIARVFPKADTAVSADEVLCPSGALRWCRSERFLAERTWYTDELAGFVMPWHRAIDIDTRTDYEAALCVAHAMDNGFQFHEAVA